MNVNDVQVMLHEYTHWDDYEEEQEGYQNSWEEMESNGVYMRDFI